MKSYLENCNMGLCPFQMQLCMLLLNVFERLLRKYEVMVFLKVKSNARGLKLLKQLCCNQSPQREAR